MSVLADEFSTVFRAEHRAVRDALLGLITAFEARDLDRVRVLLGHTAELTGPHFRYEEETLYPSLVSVFGKAYIDHLFEEHDGAIERAAALVALAGREHLEETDVEHAVQLVREILPHVSDCDGLSVMVEVLPDTEVEAIFAARERSGAEGLDLLTWAQGVRGRPLALIGRSSVTS
ncbi:MAG: hemerythrin domain-containing protein [Gaiellales bacterium]